MVRAVAVLVVVLLVAGCATSPVEQRATQGPSAFEFWALRMAKQLGRAPNFDEQRHWDDEIDGRISRYLNEHPEDANSLTVSTFRFSRQVAVGMSQEQVTILLGSPRTQLREREDLQTRARKFWPDVKDKAQEAWTYPYGWTIFFADQRVVDITQYFDPKKGEDS